MFGSVWILHSDVSKFGGIKSEHFLTLGYKIQTSQISEDEIQSLKLQSVKSKYPQTLGV